MALRMLRVGTGVGLGVSGALMIAASWQRWAEPCLRGGFLDCERRQDHLYDFVPPSDPWEPVGRAAELGGLSVLVFALVLALLPWAMTARRPGRISAVALVASVLATAAVGLATLRSGLSGGVVAPPLDTVSVLVWALVPPILVGRWVVAAHDLWAGAAGLVLILGMPLVEAFSYGIGPYDSQTWEEAVSGAFTVAAGLCLIVAAALPPKLTKPPVADPEVVPDLVDHRSTHLVDDV